MPKKKIIMGHPDHGKGGKTGHQSEEIYARSKKEEAKKERLERKKEANKRKFNARVEREIKNIISKVESQIVPIANKAFLNVKKLVKDRKKYALCVLAIDEFVFRKTKKEFESNEFIASHLGEGFWTPQIRDKYGWISPKEKTQLYALLLGKKFDIKKQKKIIRDIKAQSKNIEKWVFGRMT